LIQATSSFVKNAPQLRISKETAIILDDMHFLLQAIMTQVEQQPSEAEKVKLKSTSTWIHQRISGMDDGSQGPLLARDFIYKSCRVAGLIHCNAIVSQIPISKACTLVDLNQLWGNMWQVKLSQWKQIPGIFLFIILAAAPAAQYTPHGRFLKNMMKATCLSMRLDDWNVVDASLDTYVKLQRWLRRVNEEVVGLTAPKPLEFLHIYEG
jgi:hypothetical protein